MTPTWEQQKAKARRQALWATPILFAIAALCYGGIWVTADDDPVPAVDSPSQATPAPTRTNEIFNPVEGAPGTAGPDDPTPPAVPKPPPPGPNPNPNPQPNPNPPPPDDDEAEEDEEEGAYYANCAEARRAGAAPIYRGEPGYRRALDRDGDGKACD